MDHSTFKWIDVAIGGPQNRNNVVDLTTFKVPDSVDCYRTVFRFNQNYHDYWKKTGSVSGFKGRCFTDYFPIDIDSEDLNESIKMTNEAIEILRIDFDYEVRHLYFSGKKGFHIVIPILAFGKLNPSENMPKVFKSIASDLLDGIADQAIYEINRLFRINNTKHSGTGLYKINIEISDLEKGVEHILELAKTKREKVSPSLFDAVKNEQLFELFNKHNSIKPESKKATLFEGTPKGDRNARAASMAGLYRKKDFDINAAREAMRGWNLQNVPPMDEDELESVIQSIYKYPNQTTELEKDIYPIWSLYDEYRDYVTSSKQVNIGIPEIDQKIRGIRPGQVMTIMGFTGNFKSATLQAMLNHYHEYSKEPVLMFELEMSRLDIFERAAQMAILQGGQDVENIFKNQSDEDVEYVIGIMQRKYESFYVVDVPAIDCELLKKYTEIAEQKIIGRKIGLVGIDFIQLMQGRGNSSVQKIDDVAKTIKTYAKEMNVPVISISQVTDVESWETEIDLMKSRDSKTIPQMSDFVLGIWKDDSCDEYQQVISILKNRKGALGKVIRTVNRQTLRFDSTQF